MPNDNKQEQTSATIRNSAVNPLVDKRREVDFKFNQHVNAKAEALNKGDARALLAAETDLLQTTSNVVQVCAELDAALDGYKESYEAEFARDWTQAHAALKPIRDRLKVLRAEVDDLEAQEAVQLERIAPEVANIEERKRTAAKWENERRQECGELVRRLQASGVR